MTSTLQNQVVFMTGATSGLGKACALKAIDEGATMILLLRDKSKGIRFTEELKQKFPNHKGKYHFVEGNLSHFESLVKVCTEVKSQFPPLDMMIHNAGIMNYTFRKTSNHIEETIQVNLLSPLLITTLLIDHRKANNPTKIIFTASELHKGNIQWDDLEFTKKFEPFRVYSHSKLGVLLVMRLLAQKLKAKGIQVYAQHPGLVRTELGRDADWFSKFFFLLMGTSPEKGAQNLLYLMHTAPEHLVSGEYYAAQKIKKSSPQSYQMDQAEQLYTKLLHYIAPYIDQNQI